MTVEVPCQDCAGLVGSGPYASPHRSLRVFRDTRIRQIFRCTECGIVWSKEELGWCRLVDRQPEPL